MTPPVDRKFRILQIHPFLKGEGLNPKAGGKSRLSLQLSRELALRGYHVAIFPYPEPLLDKTYAIDNGPATLSLLPTTRFPPLAKQGSYLWKSSRLPREGQSFHDIRLGSLFLAGLHEAVREFRPDLIHCHSSFSDFPMLHHALGLDVPMVLTHHTHEPGMYLHAYQRLIFSSEALRTLVCGRDRLLARRSRLIRPAVERLFSDPSVRVDGKRRGIVFVGGLRLDKGLQNLLAAYAQSSALRKIPLRICGIGPEQNRFRDFCRRHRIPAAFLGRIAPRDVQKELLTALLLVNPSPAEGFSIALAEAMCSGTPVIGWKPQMEESAGLLRMECGAGFDPAASGPDELADLVLDWIGRRKVQSARHRKSLAAKARMVFSIERYTTENLVVYDELTGDAA
jgi:glycosyltransferase involved in cell wall biosynthesis